MKGLPNQPLYDRVRLLYDSLMDRPQERAYYGRSGFYNYGYWLEGTHSQQEACENLMEQLLALIPEKRGRILDVACGLGATTRHLLNCYPASAVVGINISAKQLAESQLNTPGCRFIRMDAARLAFADGVFEQLICVESAFHFETREQFLSEAFRVLKPGGSLVLADILFRHVPGQRYRYVPRANFVETLAAYRALYQQAGFQQVDIVDATKECWRGFRHHLLRWLCQQVLAREIGIRAGSKEVLWLLVLTAILRHYLLVSAHKG